MSTPGIQNPKFGVLLVSLFLAAAVWIVFGETVHYGFVNYDDGAYVYQNAVVKGGLHIKGIAWAFTHVVSANWHPLTILSLMLDGQIYGKWTGGYHLTNLLLHAIVAVLLFFVLREMTGTLWRSAFVAAVFAIHPLRVESVAWISERKDVLSGVFFMLTLWAYVRYARNPPSLARYLVVAVLLALGLMSKPTLVTLPFVLLLLDYWPLERFSRPSSANQNLQGASLRLFAEKLPLISLSVLSCMATILAEQGLINPNGRDSLSRRVAEAFVAYAVYIGQTVHPVGLTVFYPRSREIPAWEILGAVASLGSVSIAVFLARRKQPWLLVGWFWFLGVLVPMIGLVNVGDKAHADRYTYLSQIGIYIAATWAVADLGASLPGHRFLRYGIPLAVLTALGITARAQVLFWRNSEALWSHALDCTSRNFRAEWNLGLVFTQEGRMSEAIKCYQKALESKNDPAEVGPHYNDVRADLDRLDESFARYQLGNALLGQRRVADSILQYQKIVEILSVSHQHPNRLGEAPSKTGSLDEATAGRRKAMEIRPGSEIAAGILDPDLDRITKTDGTILLAETRNNLGTALIAVGRLDEAVAHYQKAVEIEPDFALAHYNLGNMLLRQRRIVEAILQYQNALEIQPDSPEAHNNLANALLQTGRTDEAAAEYRIALQIRPDFAEAHANFGQLLAKTGKHDDAIVQYRKAIESMPGDARTHANLGMAFAADHRNSEAIAELRKASELDPGNATRHDEFGVALANGGFLGPAISEFQQTLAIAPDNPKAHEDLAKALLASGRVEESASHYRSALRTTHPNLSVLNDLAWLLATNPAGSVRNGAEAVALAERANTVAAGKDPAILDTLAAAYAEAGRFTEAVETAAKSSNLASAQNNAELAGEIRKRLSLYKEGSPYRDPQKTPSLARPANP